MAFYWHCFALPSFRVVRPGYCFSPHITCCTSLAYPIPPRLTPQRRRRDARDLDADEEAYFNTSKPDDPSPRARPQWSADGPHPRPPPNAFRSRLELRQVPRENSLLHRPGPRCGTNSGSGPGAGPGAGPGPTQGGVLGAMSETDEVRRQGRGRGTIVLGTEALPGRADAPGQAPVGVPASPA